MTETTEYQQNELPLSSLQARRSKALATYLRETSSIEDYVMQLADDRTVICRSATWNADPGEDHTSDPTDQSTCTAFVAAHFIDVENVLVDLARRARGPNPAHVRFAGVHTNEIVRTIFSDFQKHYTTTAADHRLNTDHAHAKDTATLPNAYNTPIHLAGLAAAIRYQGKQRPEEEILAAGSAVASQIVEWITSGRGLVQDIRQREPMRAEAFNPYLTYWCTRSLVSWDALMRSLEDPDDRTYTRSHLASATRSALEISLEATLNQLSRVVAAIHSGVVSLYDSVDLTCTLAEVALVSRRLGRRDELIRALTQHAVDLLMRHFVLPDGSFAPKAPALTTQSGYSLVLSSPELAAILIHAVRQDLSPRAVAALDPILDNVCRRAGGVRGWGREAKESSLRRPAFVAAGALAFLHTYHRTLDGLIAQRCARELGVQPYAPDSSLREFTLPESIREDIDNHVIHQIRDKKRRDLAVMSFILGGPPGTAKTTIAKKIAQELRWPILTLDQGTFLREGAAHLESEAERIFDLLLELSDTVVLFDEFEDMIENRAIGEKAGRFLTTSMLPRIHRLRDLGRVIFIIATNHPDRIDSAASRPGRIDRIFEVKPPNRQERLAILDMWLERFGALQNLRELFHQVGVASATDGFTYVYLRELVRACVTRTEVSGILSEQDITDELDRMTERVRSEQASSDTRRR